jgi:hypothetical protein
MFSVAINSPFGFSVQLSALWPTAARETLACSAA